MAKLFDQVATHLEDMKKTYEKYEKDDFYVKLKLKEDKESIDLIQLSIEGLQLRFSIVGEFSSGKSTFVNAILQEDLLPASFRPTTSQVMEIANDEQSKSIAVSSSPSTTRLLNKENIKQLAEETSERLTIRTSIPEPMKQFIIYDTPGVNDSALLSEEIIFDLLSDSDIVVFLMRADNALKQTEADFLKRLVTKKDLSKFFFIINFSDNISDQSQLTALKAHVTQGIGNILEWPKDQVKDRVFLYSAKQSLIAGINNRFDEVSWKKHAQLLDALSTFASNRREDLESAAFNQALVAAVQLTIEKLEVAKEQIGGEKVDYEEQLRKIDDEISAFSVEVEKEMDQYRSLLRENQQSLKDGITSDFENIKQDTIDAIKQMPDSDLERADIIRKHIRKQIEDSLQNQSAIFWKKLKLATEQTDANVAPVLERSLMRIGGYKKGFDASPLVTVAAMGVAGYAGATILLPWVLGAAGIVGAIGIVGAVALGGGVMPALAGLGQVGGVIGAAAMKALPTVGNTALKTGKTLASASSKSIGYSYNGLQQSLSEYMGSRNKADYALQLAEQLDEMKRQILEKIDSSIDADDLVNRYVEAKFPQRNETERRINAKREHLTEDRENLSSEVEKIEEMMTMLMRKIIKQSKLGAA